MAAQCLVLRNQFLFYPWPARSLSLSKWFRDNGSQIEITTIKMLVRQMRSLPKQKIPNWNLCLYFFFCPLFHLGQTKLLSTMYHHLLSALQPDYMQSTWRLPWIYNTQYWKVSSLNRYLSLGKQAFVLYSRRRKRKGELKWNVI